MYIYIYSYIPGYTYAARQEIRHFMDALIYIYIFKNKCIHIYIFIIYSYISIDSIWYSIYKYISYSRLHQSLQASPGPLNAQPRAQANSFWKSPAKRNWHQAQWIHGIGEDKKWWFSMKNGDFLWKNGDFLWKNGDFP